MKRRRPVAIDLFSGCGGLSLGLRKGGFAVIGAIENDEIAAATYAANHRNVRLWRRNIRWVSAVSVMRELGLRPGELDLLAACPPCQGFSAMRTLNGQRAMRDRRNGLIREFLRFVRKLRPKAIMLENVPNLRFHWRFRKLCSALERLDYEINYDVRDAAKHGVPQRRKRLILMASRKGKVPFPATMNSRRTVAMAIRGLAPAGTSGDRIHDLPELRSRKVQRLIAKIPKDGGSRLALPRQRQLRCHRVCDGFKDVYGRMAWKALAPTITSGCFNPSKGRFLHPVENRNITMREAAMLQSFPKSYRFPRVAHKTALASMIGNALPPEFIRHHAREVRLFLKANGTSKKATRSQRGRRRCRTQKRPYSLT